MKHRIVLHSGHRQTLMLTPITSLWYSMTGFISVSPDTPSCTPYTHMYTTHVCHTHIYIFIQTSIFLETMHFTVLRPIILIYWRKTLPKYATHLQIKKKLFLWPRKTVPSASGKLKKAEKQKLLILSSLCDLTVISVIDISKSGHRAPASSSHQRDIYPKPFRLCEPNEVNSLLWMQSRSGHDSCVQQTTASSFRIIDFTRPSTASRSYFK